MATPDSYRSLFWMLCALLTINFALDLWRRHEFESDKAALARLSSRVSTTVEDKVAVLESLHSTLQEQLDNLIARTDDLAAYTRAVMTKAHQLPAPQPIEPTPVPVHDAPSIFDLPIEVLHDRLSAHKDDQFFRQFASTVQDPQTWKADEVIASLESFFSMQLSPEDKELLTEMLEYHRKVAHISYANFDAEGHLLALQRIQAGDYLTPDATGRFPSAANHKDSFHMRHVAGKRLLWTKEQAPELYRRWQVFQYAPMAMLEDAHDFFTQRSTR